MLEKIQKMINSLGPKEKVYEGDDGHTYLGSSYSSPIMSFYKGKSFDNTYPSISRVVNEFLKIRPYAIDANGKPLKNAHIIDVLYRPNQNMGGVDFREVLALMALVHRKVYILVSHSGSQITPDNITGFTFLTGVSEVSAEDGKRYYANGKVYTSNEVIEIFSGYDPYNLGRGYSPSVAVAKWAGLDDYIAAYEAGLFENGAVPAGQFVITATNPEKFRDIAETMQRKHRGSGRNNNVIYTYRAVEPTTGQPLQSQIEWIPFAQSNRDMSLEDIFNQVNQKIDSNFGVPASVRGVNKQNTYASVRVDQQVFIQYVVDPLALKLWSRFTFELNRLTGGLGYSITYDLEVPGVAEEEKIQAETETINLGIIERGLALGYSLDSIVDAFGLSVRYKLLKTDNSKPTIDNDKPEVDEGDEVQDAPEDLNNTKQKKSNEKPIATKTKNIITKFLNNQIENAIDNLDGSSKNEDDPDEENKKEFIKKMLAAAVIYMLVKGKISYKKGITLIVASGYSTEEATSYVVSNSFKKEYKKILKKLATSFAKDTNKSIQDVLSLARQEGLSKEQTAQKLREITKTDEWRIQRLAQTEVHRWTGLAGIDSMTQLMNETGVKIKKVWFTNPGHEPCEFCKAVQDKEALVNEPFFLKGDLIHGKDGGVYKNDFDDIDSANLHPHCKCSVRYEVVK